MLDRNVTQNERDGCLNNTLAHEAFHWFRHRVYATMRNALHGDTFIACRKPPRLRLVSKPWTDEDRLEWQANSVAPRILMPLEPFKIKAREVMAKRKYRDNADNSAAVLDLVIRDLAGFFEVSKQSVAIRLAETGFVSNDTPQSVWPERGLNKTTKISGDDAFREYRENEEFRAFLNTGAFIYVEGRFVLNDKKYIATFGGQKSLTAYARLHLSECSLTFVLRKVYPHRESFSRGVAYRYDNSKLKTEARFEPDNSGCGMSLEELSKLGEKFNAEFGDFAENTRTFGEIAVRQMKKKHWNRTIFKEMTHLDDAAYSRFINGKTKGVTARTVAAFCVGIGASVKLADELFTAAGYSLYNDAERYAYLYLATYMQGRTIDECNAFLESQGFEPLGNRARAVREVVNQ